MATPEPVVFKGGKGYDAATDAMSLDPGATDDHLNVEGGGGVLWRKRPGTALTAVTTAIGGPVYDLVLASPYAGVQQTFCLAALAMLGNESRFCQFTPGVSFALVGVGGGTYDNAMTATLHPAGPNVVLRAGAPLGNPLAYYLRANTSTGYWEQATMTPPSTAAFNEMAYHRLHVFTGRWDNHLHRARLMYCASGDPLTWPAANYVDAYDQGRYPAVAGLAGTGEILYVGALGPGETWALTGAAPSQFRLERTNADFGFAGCRVAARFGGTLYGLAAKLQATEADSPFDIFAIAGLAAKRIGAPVRNVLTKTGAYGYRDARVAAWMEKDGVLFMPQRSGTTNAARDAVFMHVPSGTFWKWTFATALGANCFLNEMGAMWIGCADGKIRVFDPAVATDAGSTFESYGTTRPFGFQEGRQAKPQSIVVIGKQTSGGASSYQTQGDDGTWTTAKTFTLPTTLGAVVLSPADVPASYVNRIKVTFPTDGVGCEVQEMAVDLKPFGRT